MMNFQRAAINSGYAPANGLAGSASGLAIEDG
jgi:hypothetical protein